MTSRMEDDEAEKAFDCPVLAGCCGGWWIKRREAVRWPVIMMMRRRRRRRGDTRSQGQSGWHLVMSCSVLACPVISTITDRREHQGTPGNTTESMIMIALQWVTAVSVTATIAVAVQVRPWFSVIFVMQILSLTLSVTLTVTARLSQLCSPVCHEGRELARWQEVVSRRVWSSQLYQPVLSQSVQRGIIQLTNWWMIIREKLTRLREACSSGPLVSHECRQASRDKTSLNNLTDEKVWCDVRSVRDAAMWWCMVTTYNKLLAVLSHHDDTLTQENLHHLHCLHQKLHSEAPKLLGGLHRNICRLYNDKAKPKVREPTLVDADQSYIVHQLIWRDNGWDLGPGTSPLLYIIVNFQLSSQIEETH